MGVETTLDSLMPPEVAARAEMLGVKKAGLPLVPLLALSVLAGAFIAMGALFYTVTVTGSAEHIGYGLTRLLGGLAFSLGLILVVVGGAELFTGNNLLVMALVGGHLTLPKLIRNWVIVYIGNFLGALLTAWLIYLTGIHGGHHGVAETALKVAAGKCTLAWTPALVRGIYCNALVCLAVWLTYSCRTTGDRILAIVFPITAFVAAGFEHCVANMYFIPYGLLLKADPAATSQLATGALDSLTWSRFLVNNLVPVTIGNIIGGGVFVGLVYWVAYLRQAHTHDTP